MSPLRNLRANNEKIIPGECEAFTGRYAEGRKAVAEQTKLLVGMARHSRLQGGTGYTAEPSGCEVSAGIDRSGIRTVCQ